MASGVRMRPHHVFDGIRTHLSLSVGGPARLRVIVLLASALGLESADNASIGAVAGPLKHSLQMGNAKLGLLLTLSTAIGALATLPAGLLVDRLNRVKLLAVAATLWSTAMLVSSLATSYSMLLVTRLALGLVVGVTGPAVASLTGDLFPPAERGRIYGYVLAGELAGGGAGFLVSGNVAAWLSWRAAFVALAVPGYLLVVQLLRLLPEPARGGSSRLDVGADAISGGPHPAAADDADAEPAAESDAVMTAIEDAGVHPRRELLPSTGPEQMRLFQSVRYILSIPTNRLLIVASAMGYFFFSGLRAFAVEYMRGHFHLGQSTASTLLFVLGTGSLVGVLVGGRLADWLTTQRRLVSARPIVSGAAFLVAAGLFIPALLLPTLLLAAPVTFAAAAAYGATNPPLDAARLDVIHHGLWGRADATRTVFRSLFEAAAPLAFGLVSTLFGGHETGLRAGADGSQPAVATGLDQTFLIMLVPLIVAGVLLTMRVRKDYPRDVATAEEWERRTGSQPS